MEKYQFASGLPLLLTHENLVITRGSITTIKIKKERLPGENALIYFTLFIKESKNHVSTLDERETHGPCPRLLRE